MKKKNKSKYGIIIGIVLAIIVIASALLILLFKEDKKTSLTILEKRWIEDNKNQIIDFGITYDIPMYTLSGEGVIFEYLSALEKNTGLEFNKVPYEINSEITQEYYFSNVTELPKDNYILLDSTNYVLISKENKEIKMLQQTDIIGVLKNDLELSKYYTDLGATYKSYDTVSTLIEAYKNNNIKYMILPHSVYLKSILQLSDSYIVKNITEMQQYYIIKLSSKNKKLNSIIKKYYEKWSTENKDRLYNEALLELYYSEKNIDQQKSNTLNAKTYTYGYIENLPYEGIINGTLYGIVGEYLKQFSKLTGTDFEYKAYKSVNELKNAIENKEIDIAFGYYETENEKNIKSLNIDDINFVILTNTNNDLIVNSLKSLKGKEVSVIKDTIIRDYILNNSEATLKEHNTLKSLLESRNGNSIIVIDEATYEYYRDTVLKDYSVIYRNTISNGYKFLISNSDENELFSEIFDYYLSFTDGNYRKEGFLNLVKEKSSFKNSEKKYLGYALILMIVLLVIISRILKIGKQNKQNRREEKIRFIDMLTSLKNRNYLNSHMSEWNDNKVYPQAIVVIDLNNIKYINDNYGYEEGDSVIGMAANILINTQLENTDIIRTDGNEFLVYMVGYDDKKVIAYIRKLYKELQQLPHEFGAALGYSMIEDDIKTIDDAINEATLDMRKNKENLEQ